MAVAVVGVVGGTSPGGDGSPGGAPGGDAGQRTTPGGFKVPGSGAEAPETVEQAIRNQGGDPGGGGEGGGGAKGAGTAAALREPEMSPEEFMKTSEYSPRPSGTVPIGVTQNNPFNIKWSGSNWQKKNLPDISRGTTKDQGDPQARFGSPQAGYNAGARLLLQKTDGGFGTIKEMISGPGGWTPSSKASTSFASTARTLTRMTGDAATASWRSIGNAGSKGRS